MTTIRIVEEYRQVPLWTIARASTAVLSYSERAPSIPAAVYKRNEAWIELAWKIADMASKK